LGEATDGFREEEEDGALALEVELLAGNDGRPGVDEEGHCDGPEDGGRNGKVGVDLAHVDNRDEDGDRTLESVYEP
jgi:hypothetical protein